MKYDPDIQVMIDNKDVDLLATTLQAYRKLLVDTETKAYMRGREEGYQEHQTHMLGQDMGH